MYSDEAAINIKNLGKMYKLYKNPKDKIKDAFGLNFYKKNYYKEFWALRGIDITVKKGERVGLIGHNGAGKSTLLKTIIGNIQPTEGSIEIQGNIQALLELGTGFHPEFTGRENIKASLAYQGLKLKDIEIAEREIIDFTELGEYIDQPVRTYSAGMYSRLAFATATVVSPEILIIDEVLGAGDAYFMGKCVERMRKLTSEEGTTVLFVSHDLQSVQSLCDRVVWIDKGSVRYDGEVLKGIKLYTQAVRKNEELRLKMRDMKISKNQAMVLDRKSDLYNEYLFHFISNSEAKICKVYNISIYSDNDVVASIDVGAPMDNNVELDNCIIDDMESACWGKSRRDQIGFYREYNNMLGENKHAPFRMSVSKMQQLSKLRMEIQMDILEEYKLDLQIFDNDLGEYKSCSIQHEEGNRYCAEIGFIEKNVETKIEEKESKEVEAEEEVVVGELVNEEILNEEILVDNIETEHAKIKDIVVKNKQGREGNVFSYQENIGECVIDLIFKNPCKKFIIAFLVYSMKGDLVLSSCQQVKLESALKRTEIHYKFPDMKLGSGEYTISVGIYDKLNIRDNSKEQKFLALLDRGVSFKIEKPEEFALNMGFFVSNQLIEITDVNKENIECSLLI